MRIPSLYRERCRVLPKPELIGILIPGDTKNEFRRVRNSWLWKYTDDPESLGGYQHGRR